MSMSAGEPEHATSRTRSGRMRISARAPSSPVFGQQCPHRTVERDRVAAPAGIRGDADRAGHVGDGAPRVGGHERLIGETDDHAVGAEFAGRRVQRRAHGGDLPVGPPGVDDDASIAGDLLAGSLGGRATTPPVTTTIGPTPASRHVTKGTFGDRFGGFGRRRAEAGVELVGAVRDRSKRAIRRRPPALLHHHRSTGLVAFGRLVSAASTGPFCRARPGAERNRFPDDARPTDGCRKVTKS